MPDEPLVSVIIPAHDAADQIGETLASVLSQTYRKLEVIVVDDGSRDQTSQVVEAVAGQDGRVTLLRQSNQGVAAARNLAIKAARGEFIAPIDADDTWFPTKIERQVQRMQEGGSAVGLVYTWWVGLDEAGRIVGVAPRWSLEGSVYASLLYVNFIGNASVPLIRRSCIECVGGYDTSLKARGGQGCEDWDLALRVAERYEFRVVPSYLTGYRNTYNSMSSQTEAMKQSYDLLLEGVQRRLPGIAPDLLRWSRSHFYFYLASLSYNTGRFGDALKSYREVVRIDPAALLAPRLVKASFKSLVRLCMAPLTAVIWPEHRDWIRFKHNIKPRPTFNITDLEASTVGVSPFGWKPWKPYDRILLRRWRKITKGMT